MPLHIGVIYPKGGEGETEFSGLNNWFRRHDLPEGSAEVVWSESDGLHDLQSLRRTGNRDVILAAARQLTPGACQSVVWACTSGSFVEGFSTTRAQADALSACVGAPATSASLALARAAIAMGGGPLDVLSPYPDDVSERFVSFFAEAGVRVGSISALGAVDGAQSRAMDLGAAIEAHETRNGASGRPLVVPDTAIDTLDLVTGLETRFGRAVITANQACVWDALRLAGFVNRLPAAGRLFEIGTAKGDLPW